MVHFLFDILIGMGLGVVLCAYFPEKLVKFKKMIFDLVHKNESCEHDKK